MRSAIWKTTIGFHGGLLLNNRETGLCWELFMGGTWVEFLRKLVDNSQLIKRYVSLMWVKLIFNHIVWNLQLNQQEHISSTHMTSAHFNAVILLGLHFNARKRIHVTQVPSFLFQWFTFHLVLHYWWHSWLNFSCTTHSCHLVLHSEMQYK